MKELFIYSILIVILSFNLCDIINDIFKNLDFYERLDKTGKNIHTETIQYGLSYDNSSVVKVYIKLADEGFKKKIKFIAYLKAEFEKKEYILNCSNPSNDFIVCDSKPDIKLNTDDKYYIYYNRPDNKSIMFDYENILEDYKRISLIFKPELYVNQTVYKDNKKIMAQINQTTVGDGYLYIVNKKKKVLNKPKDGFNKYIELNNFVFQPEIKQYGIKNISNDYKLAIRKGYHMIEAEIQFTKDFIPIVYYAEKDISSQTLDELKKSEDILTLWNLLKLCKENKVILVLKFSFLDLKKESSNIVRYAKNLIKLVEDNVMFDSIFFDDLKQELILELIKIKNSVSITISNLNNEKDIDKIKDKYKDSKRIIYCLNVNKINEKLVKYIKSLGIKIKVSQVNEINLANKIQSWGVNYITTNNLPPFLINNEKDEPFRVKCVNIFMDDLSECKMGNEIILRDNEFYNIHYSLNIYNKSEDINETAIGEFRYEDTKINDNKYYIIKYMDFKKGIIHLITSNKVEKGKLLKGVIGPKFDNVAEIYQYNFTCEGINQNIITCKIEKALDKIEFEGEYAIYYLANYSFNEEEIEDFRLSKLKNKHIYSKHEKKICIAFVIIISIIFLFVSYFIQDESYINILKEPKTRGIPLIKIPKTMNLYTEINSN